MEKEFTQYTEALALKELGFDEKCYGYFTRDEEFFYFDVDDLSSAYTKNMDNLVVNSVNGLECTAPLYQHAFRWCREKYNIHAEITWSPSYEYDPGEWSDAIYEITFVDVSYTKEWKAESPDMQRGNGKQLTYEEAELACLEKLIEIVKEK